MEGDATPTTAMRASTCRAAFNLYQLLCSACLIPPAWSATSHLALPPCQQVPLEQVFGSSVQKVVAHLNIEGQHRGAVAAAKAAQVRQKKKSGRARKAACG